MFHRIHPPTDVCPLIQLENHMQDHPLGMENRTNSQVEINFSGLIVQYKSRTDRLGSPCHHSDWNRKLKTIRQPLPASCYLLHSVRPCDVHPTLPKQHERHLQCCYCMGVDSRGPRTLTHTKVESHSSTTLVITLLSFPVMVMCLWHLLLWLNHPVYKATTGMLSEWH